MTRVKKSEIRDAEDFRIANQRLKAFRTNQAISLKKLKRELRLKD